MRTIDELIVTARARGGKATAQRVIIWRALAQDHTHPTAEDLFARLKPELPTLSLTTLYHTLNDLVEWGEIRRFDTGDGHIHFDPDTTPHAELVCMRCHSVIDAPADAHTSQALPERLAGYRIVTRTEQYFGYCPDCQRAMAAKE